MRLLTIGFTQKTAERFFDLLVAHRVQVLVDIRLKPDGQLSGFAKRGDLPFFLQRLANCDYVHLPDLAPTPEIMELARKDHDWGPFRERFVALLDARGVPGTLDRSLFERRDCCLLCSEAKPEECHRTIVADRLQRVWGNVEIIHLM